MAPKLTVVGQAPEGGVPEGGVPEGGEITALKIHGVTRACSHSENRRLHCPLSSQNCEIVYTEAPTILILQYFIGKVLKEYTKVLKEYTKVLKFGLQNEHN